MKRIVAIFTAFAACLSAGTMLNAAEKQYEYDLASFNAIKVGGNFEVIIEKGSAYHASVTVDEACYKLVTCSVKGNTLTLTEDDKDITKEIKNLLNNTQPVFKAVVTVPVSPDEIVINDKAVVECSVLCEGCNVKVSVSDNASLKNFTANCKYFSLKADKRSNVNVNVTADDVDVDMNNTSSVSLTQKGKAIDINLAAASNFTLYGNSEEMTLNSKGSAKALLNGEATKAKYTITGSCNINASALIGDNAEVKMTGLSTANVAAAKNLSVNIQSGATLIFSNSPVFEIVQVKASTLKPAEK